ncbi:hypothetical protein L208DRAFT_1389908 [Tricholoma matsutake]|nr:hypothetical protein L208DRAFT_1389908 [Tricholoma matsutake 945]
MALCTCQKFCQAPPEGKAIPVRTWYNHAAQRTLEDQMTQEQRDAQKSRTRKATRPQLQRENSFDLDNDILPNNIALVIHFFSFQILSRTCVVSLAVDSGEGQHCHTLLDCVSTDKGSRSRCRECHKHPL